MFLAGESEMPIPIPPDNTPAQPQFYCTVCRCFQQVKQGAARFIPMKLDSSLLMKYASHETKCSLGHTTESMYVSTSQNKADLAETEVIK